MPTAIKNLTHTSQIQKYLPDSKIPDLISKAQKSQDKYALSLRGDNTKTEPEKTRLQAEYGGKLIKPLLDIVQKNIEVTRSTINRYQSTIDNELKIKGTTDVVILNSYAQALDGMSTSEIMAMANENVDIARASLLSPILKVKLKLNDSNKEHFTDLVKRNALGDDYKLLKEAEKQSEVLHTTGDGLMNSYIDFNKQQTAILDQVVNMPHVPEVG